jgi:DNA polymerase-3 subunit epsilon
MHIDLKTALADLEFVAFDTETTGSSPIASSLVEIGAVRFSLSEGPSSYFQTLINPRVPIPSFVTGIHGISDEMVREAPKVEAVLPHFFRFLEGAILVAHNARFDVDFVALASSRSSLEPPINPILDSCRFARRAIPGFKSYALGNLTRELGIESTTFHRAEADAVSCMEVFRHAVARGLGEKADWASLVAKNGPPLGFRETLKPVNEMEARLEPLLDALRARNRIAIEYEGGYGPRDITPLLIYAKGGGRYLEALCHIHGIRKTFRLDKIATVLAATHDETS